MLDTLLRISHVSLTLLYSSLTKLFLLLMLALWKPSSLPSPHAFLLRNGTNEGMLSSFISHDLTQRALQMLDDDKLDREWIVRNVLGGLSAGFGLRGVYIAVGIRGLPLRSWHQLCLMFHQSSPLL